MKFSDIRNQSDDQLNEQLGQLNGLVLDEGATKEELRPVKKQLVRYLLSLHITVMLIYL